MKLIMFTIAGLLMIGGCKNDPVVVSKISSDVPNEGLITDKKTARKFKKKALELAATFNSAKENSRDLIDSDIGERSPRQRRMQLLYGIKNLVIDIDHAERLIAELETTIKIYKKYPEFAGSGPNKVFLAKAVFGKYREKMDQLMVQDEDDRTTLLHWKVKTIRLLALGQSETGEIAETSYDAYEKFIELLDEAEEAVQEIKTAIRSGVDVEEPGGGRAPEIICGSRYDNGAAPYAFFHDNNRLDAVYSTLDSCKQAKDRFKEIDGQYLYCASRYSNGANPWSFFVLNPSSDSGFMAKEFIFQDSEACQDGLKKMFEAAPKTLWGCASRYSNGDGPVAIGQFKEDERKIIRELVWQNTSDCEKATAKARRSLERGNSFRICASRYQNGRSPFALFTVQDDGQIIGGVILNSIDDCIEAY